MNLAWHHFRKDLRRFQVFLALWFGLLLLDLAVNLGWVGQMEFSPIYGFDRASNVWTTILPGVVWALVGLLPSLVVLADSPARRGGFLATRPLPKGDLFLVKMFFVIALVVAPWTVQELVHLKLQGMPLWVIERGTFERLLWALPVAVGCGAFAALWPGHARWVRAIGLCFAGYILLMAGVSLWVYLFHLHGISIGPERLPGILCVQAFALTLMGFSIWHARAHRSVLARWGGLIFVLVFSQWLVSFWPWETFKLRPENPALARKAMASSGFQIPLRNLSLKRETGAEESKRPQFLVSVDVQTTTLPAGQLVEWSGKDVRLVRTAGGELRGDRKDFSPDIFGGILGNNSYTLADYTAWSGEFPDDVMFHDSSYYAANPPDNFSLGRFYLPANRAEFSEPLTVQASLEARVFQWHKIADLPLRPGATSADEFGSWKFVATKLDHPTIKDLYVERRQIIANCCRPKHCASRRKPKTRRPMRICAGISCTSPTATTACCRLWNNALASTPPGWCGRPGRVLGLG